MWQVTAGGKDHDTQEQGNQDKDGYDSSLRKDIEDGKAGNVEDCKNGQTGSCNVDCIGAKGKALRSNSKSKVKTALVKDISLVLGNSMP